MPGSLAPFLPPHLLVDLASGRVPLRLPAVVRRPAALLMSDISGFTALTERLQARGRQGAEEVAAVVDRALRGAVGAIERLGGSVLGFGGDAVLAWFSGASAVRRAVAAAEAVRARVAAGGHVRTSLGVVAVEVGQVVHYGEVAELHLGGRDRRHFLVVGPTVRELVRLEETVPPNAIRVSAAARRRMPRERPRSASPQDRQPRRTRPPRQILASYLGPVLAARPARFHGHYRDAAILFLEARGSHPGHLDRFTRGLDAILATLGGLLLKTDPSRDGTRFLCVFGIPEVHEEDVFRAARAGLEALACGPRGQSIRGGLAAGTVVNLEIGTRRRRSFDVMGDVVNMAARASSAARWGEVRLTDGVAARLGPGAFSRRRSIRVKGREEPVRFHVLRSVPAAARSLQVTAPLVGRGAEMAVLADALHRAHAGEGRVVAIAGEAGIGKSRLRWEIAKLAAELGFVEHEGRAAPFGGRPGGVVADLLAQALGLAVAMAPDALRDRLAQAAERLGIGTTDRDHLGVLLGAWSASAGLSPGTVRQNNALAVRAWVRALSRAAPRLLVLEDLQWADDEAQAAIAAVAEGIAGAPALLLLLHRPGFVPPPSAVTVGLAPLPPSAVKEMLASLMGGIPEGVRRLMEGRVEGNPLYAEEMVRHLHESGLVARGESGPRLVREPGPDDLPDSLSSLVAGRLDRLPEAARWVVDLGSVLGRSFPRDVAEALPSGRKALAEALPHLAAHEVLFERETPAGAELIFKHALIRDVAYARLLVARRRKLHRMVARGLGRLSPRGGAGLALQAHHWEQAVDGARARRLYRAAADEAMKRSAFDEAAVCAGRYLGLTPRPSRVSVTLRIKRAAEALRYLGRYPEAERELTRALEEARTLRDRRRQLEALSGLGHVCHETGRPDAAFHLYDQALTLARQIGDGLLVNNALHHQAVVHMEQGRNDDARTLFLQSLRVHRRRGDSGNVARTLCNLAVLHQGQGRFAEAQRLYEEALHLARDRGERRLQGILLLNLGEIHQEAQRMDEARTCYDASQAIMVEVGDCRFQGISLGALATLEDTGGRQEQSTSLFAAAIARLSEVGDRRWVAILRGFSGPPLAALGQVDEARQALEEAVRECGLLLDRRTEGICHLNLAILHRRTGDFEAAAHHLDEAERCQRDVAETMELGKCACERVHLALARDAEPSDLLADAAARTREAAAPAQSNLGRQLGRAERAVALWRAGAVLVFGECADDVPLALRRAGSAAVG